jgi:hypothetical protein
MTKLLVHWKVGKAVYTPFAQNTDTDILGIDAGALPLTSPLEYEWLTIAELVGMNAFLVGMDTKMLTPFEADYAHTWAPQSSLPVPGVDPSAGIYYKLYILLSDTLYSDNLNSILRYYIYSILEYILCILLSDDLYSH